jgi:hypothetical protein
LEKEPDSHRKRKYKAHSIAFMLMSFSFSFPLFAVNFTIFFFEREREREVFVVDSLQVICVKEFKENHTRNQRLEKSNTREIKTIFSFLFFKSVREKMESTLSSRDDNE